MHRAAVHEEFLLLFAHQLFLSHHHGAQNRRQRGLIGEPGPENEFETPFSRLAETPVARRRNHLVEQPSPGEFEVHPRSGQIRVETAVWRVSRQLLDHADRRDCGGGQRRRGAGRQVEREIEPPAHQQMQVRRGVRDDGKALGLPATGGRWKHMGHAQRETGLARRQAIPSGRAIEPDVKVGGGRQSDSGAESQRPRLQCEAAAAPGEDDRAQDRDGGCTQERRRRKINQPACRQPGHERQQQP